MPRDAALEPRIRRNPVNKSDRLAHLTKDAWRAFTRALQARLAEHDVPFGHWTFLRILWERDGLTQRELSDEAGVMEPSTFAAIRAMEALGYVKRRQLPENRKNVYVYLTAKGRALKDKLIPLAIEVNDIAVRGIPVSEVEAARTTLLGIIENLKRVSPRPPGRARTGIGQKRGSPRSAQTSSANRSRRPGSRRSPG
jgi:DNA-binding MarR family transcriptional regulator